MYRTNPEPLLVTLFYLFFTLVGATYVGLAVTATYALISATARTFLVEPLIFKQPLTLNTFWPPYLGILIASTYVLLFGV